MAQAYQQVGTEVKYREETQTYETDLGYETVSICKPKFVFFEMVGLRPSTPHWIFFDGIDVTKWVNTSFNLGGEPLVETLDDACRTLADSEIEYLYLPEHGKLITIKNE